MEAPVTSHLVVKRTPRIMVIATTIFSATRKLGRGTAMLIAIKPTARSTAKALRICSKALEEPSIVLTIMNINTDY